MIGEYGEGIADGEILNHPYTERIFDLESELYETRDRVRELEAAMIGMRELFESRGMHAAGDMVNVINRALEGR